MGLSLSLLLSAWNEKLLDLTDTVETVMARSISFGSKDGEVILRTSSSKKQELENISYLEESDDIVKPEKQMLNFFGSLKSLVLEKNMGSNESTSNSKPNSSPEREVLEFISPRPVSELEAAATKLQKVYKSYRTRRNLADCAVVVEELWWRTLDSAALDKSSVSYFRETEHETAASRWARARTRAAKVGKGLSKDEKARKLALQHWLEAIDPRHRYGRNLHFYYDIWCESKSFQPFFYWLDIGDGKDVNLGSCPRIELQSQCIQYLGPKERETYEVVVQEGKLVYKTSGTLLTTDENEKWIFVLSTSRVLYIGQKKKGSFQHSSFLSGGVTTAAGRLVARDGILEAIWPYSGHYLPTHDNFETFISFLEEHQVDMTNIKKCTIDEDTTSFKAVGMEPMLVSAECHSEASVSITADDFDGGVSSSAAQTQQCNVGINTANIEAPKLDLTKSFSYKWTSGVGARIGCLRDYPMELQFQALEKVNLSPSGQSKSSFPVPSPRPSPNFRLSPRLANMGLPSPRGSVTATSSKFRC